MARRLSRDDIISNVYYNLETGFGSINETLKKAKEQDPTINKVDVENFMRKQPNKQIRKYRGSNSYTAPFARFEYQIDIMDMKPLTKKNRGWSSNQEQWAEIRVGGHWHLQQVGKRRPYERKIRTNHIVGDEREFQQNGFSDVRL